MKRIVSFVVLLAVGLVVVVAINRDQTSHALRSEFERKVIATFPCSEADRSFLFERVPDAHGRVGRSYLTTTGDSVRDGTGYIVAMLTELARQAQAEGRGALSEQLSEAVKRYEGR